MEVQQQPAEPIDPFDRPITGSLGIGSRRALEAFMMNLELLLPDPEAAIEFQCGAFELVMAGKDLQLHRLPAPVGVDPTATRAEAAFLKAARGYFDQHGDMLIAPIWEYLQASGQAQYLGSHAGELINDEWRIVVKVNPYFGRNVGEAGLHKDTPGDLLFFALLYCYAYKMLGPEYVLRPPLVAEHEKTLEQTLPPAFLAEIKKRLEQPMDMRIHVARLEEWGFFAGCDELIYHSTPFLHHRGSYLIKLLLEAADAATQTYFSADYQRARKLKDPHWQATPRDQVTRGVALLRQRWQDAVAIEQAELLKLFPGADFGAFLLSDVLPEDPFQEAVIGSGAAQHVVALVDRDKKLTRELSEELDKAEPLTRPLFVDFLRLWVTAERRQPSRH